MQINAQKIIIEGDVDELVNTAEAVGAEIAKQLTTSQIRNIFGEVRRIEMNWSDGSPQADQEAYRKIVLLQPKLAYQAQRERGSGVGELQQVLEPCIVAIRGAALEDRKRAFANFVDFFEAILAYHKAGGGK